MHFLRQVLKWGVSLLSLVFVAVVGAWIFAPDEELRPEVAALLARPVLPPDQDNGYYAMLGLHASPELDAHAVGRKIVVGHERALLVSTNMEGFTVEAHLGAHPVRLPGRERTLRPRHAGLSAVLS